VPFLLVGTLAVVTVLASFAFSLAVLLVTHQPEVLKRRSSVPGADVTPAAAEAESQNPSADEAARDDASDPMSRVLRDIERLATLREQGALTDKEFSAQKAKLLVAPATGTRARRPQRTS
jgi:hypothetical protein